MIVARLSQHGSVAKTTPAPHFGGQSYRQGKRIALVNAGLQGCLPDLSEQRAAHCLDRTFGLVGSRVTRHIASGGRSADIPITSLSADCQRSQVHHDRRLPTRRFRPRMRADLPARERPDTDGERS